MSAQRYRRGPAATIAAAGTNQATATAVSAEIVKVTGADGTAGVILPTAVAGGPPRVIQNAHATLSMAVYPATGAAIDAIAANGAFTLSAGQTLVLYPHSSTQWYSVGAVTGLSGAELAYLDGVTAGTGLPSKAVTLDANGDYFGPNNGGIVVGHTAQLTVAGVVPEVQVLGTTTGVDGSLALVTASTTNSARSQIVLGKVGAAALGSFTTVAQGEELGALIWVGDDGVDLATVAAMIRGVVNGAGTVAASRVPTDLVFSTDPGGADDAIAEQMRLGCGGLLLIGDTTHAAMTKGLCINQGAADDIAFSLKSSDVATVLTTIVTGTVETDDYFTISKFAGATGGTLIQALGENAAVTSNLVLESYGGQADATHSAAGRGLVEVYATQHDGANALADIGADGNAFAVRGRRGGADVCLFIVDEDGEIHSDVTLNVFDEHDDMSLVRAFDTLPGKIGAVKNHWDNYVSANEQYLIDIGVLGAPLAQGGFMNHNRLLQLHNGALWQVFSGLMDLAKAIATGKTLEEVQAMLPESMKAKLLPAA